jgi:hypothetical protein
VASEYTRRRTRRTILTRRCHAHNALAAEQDFGKQLVELARVKDDFDAWRGEGDAED